MPQMSSMDWLMLSFYFMFLYFMYLMVLYYFFLNKIKIEEKKLVFKNNKYLILW